MRLAFAGTPEFAACALAALVQAGHDIVLVLTQPDRPSGRGQRLTASPVKQLAQRLALPLAQPTRLREAADWAALLAAAPDCLIVAAYGLILPAAVLAIPRYGCLNIHASLLPRWRGAAPIQRAIAAGDEESGVCIMHMDAGLDTGPVVCRAALPIAPEDTAGSLHDKLAALGAQQIVAALQAWPESGAQPQDTTGITYAKKISTAETQLDWRAAASCLARQVRAFYPTPGARTFYQGKMIKIIAAVSEPELENVADNMPGTILGANATGLRVACGRGVLCITRLQAAGGRIMNAPDFLRGQAWLTGVATDCFTLPETGHAA